MPSLKTMLRKLAAPAVVVLVLACLLPAMTFAYTLDKFKWTTDVVRIYFRFDPGTYNGAFYQAMNKWNAVNKAVRLQIGDPGGVGTVCSDESNSATFAYSVCGAKWDDGVLAVTLTSYGPTGNARHGTVIFNANSRFDLYAGPNREDAADFNRVALHELGHFLGLDHERVAAAIMQPKIGNLENLTADDINGIRARYKSK